WYGSDYGVSLKILNADKSYGPLAPDNYELHDENGHFVGHSAEQDVDGGESSVAGEVAEVQEDGKGEMTGAAEYSGDRNVDEEAQD
uniref:Uncharacterized protein n=1 Tax=Romanomermis culicivorax TaxID=13658 RepID=A0A915J129_ROMCU